MSSRQYAYQYDTSPRKIKPDYSMPKKNAKQYNKAKVKTSNNKANNKTNEAVTKSKKINAKSTIQNTKKEIAKAKFFIFIKCLAIFGILFFIIFRNSKISESFSQIQGLKNQIAVIQKENDQLEINIQNSINLQNIEQAAKEKLGMQKLTNKQTVQISLPKKDYTEPRTEEVIIKQEEKWFDKIIEKIKNMF